MLLSATNSCMCGSVAKCKAGRSCTAQKAENLQTAEKYFTAFEGGRCENGCVPVGSWDKIIPRYTAGFW